MKAGRELDALVAEKVMGFTVTKGWVVKPGYGDSDYAKTELKDYEKDDAIEDVVITSRGSCADLTPHYSTDIAAAWQVVEKLRLKGDGTPGWFFVMEYDNADIWDVQFYEESSADGGGCLNSKWGNALTPAHAICLAALKTVKEQS